MENESQNPDVWKEVFVVQRNPDGTNPLLFVCPQRYREAASINMSGCFNIRINSSLAEVIGSKLKILTERNYAGKGSLYRIESKYFSNKRILVVDKNISEQDVSVLRSSIGDDITDFLRVEKKIQNFFTHLPFIICGFSHYTGKLSYLEGKRSYRLISREIDFLGSDDSFKASLEDLAGFTQEQLMEMQNSKHRYYGRTHIEDFNISHNTQVQTPFSITLNSDITVKKDNFLTVISEDYRDLWMFISCRVILRLS